MKRALRILIIITATLIIIASVIVPYAIKKYKAYKEAERIKNAIIKVDLIEDLNIPFGTEINLSYFISDINGELIEDKILSTEKLGKNKVSFNYINEEDIKVSYSFEYNVIDVTPPVIWLKNKYTIYSNYEGNLVEDIMCADNLDDEPTCTIEGEYNTNVVGNYPLVFKAEDDFGNVTTQNFTLTVLNPPSGGGSTTPQPYVDNRIDIAEIIAEHKNENTKIGIDISRWQGDIDYEAVKNAGVEFVFIKVGGTTGVDSDEYYVDRKFKENIEGFNRVGIPVGVYIYTFAKTPEQAVRDANWTVEQIKDYEVTLPIVYDWENWNYYNEFHLSFYSLTKNAKIFFRTVNQAGYEGMLYSSKTYLDNVWFPVEEQIWLAQYYDHVTYEGRYNYWQMTSSGKVPGISGNVDIDIMYLNN
mgnify:CR=1 FL=1